MAHFIFYVSFIPYGKLINKSICKFVPLKVPLTVCMPTKQKQYIFAQ